MTDICTNTVTALFAAAVLTANLTETLRKKPKRFKGTVAHTALSHHLCHVVQLLNTVRYALFTAYYFIFIYIYAFCRRFFFLSKATCIAFRNFISISLSDLNSGMPDVCHMTLRMSRYAGNNVIMHFF